MSRSASRRELAKTIVLRCAWTRSSTRSSTAGQIEVRGWLPAAEPSSSPVGCPSSLMSSTGTTTERSHSFGRRRRDDLAPAGRRRGRWRPPRSGGRSPTGRSAAPAAPAARRAGRADTARCAPRLVCGDGVHLVDDHRLDAAQRLARGAGEQQEQRLGRGDEDVGGPAGEGAPLVGRGVAGADADPDLRARQARAGPPPGRCRSAARAGCARRRRPAPSAARRRGPGRRAARRPAGVAASRSSDQRKAASVLPEPVGATTRACSPLLIAVPGALLGGGGPLEGAGEPGPGGLGEPVERGRRRGHAGQCPRGVRHSAGPWSSRPTCCASARTSRSSAGCPASAAGELITAIAMTEPGAGSDLQGIQTRAVKQDGGGWVLNGSKTFITNGIQLRPGHRRRLYRSGGNGCTGHQPAGGRARTWRASSGAVNLDKIGLEGAGHRGAARSTDVQVPAENLLGRRGPGLHLPDAEPPAGAAVSIADRGGRGACEGVLATTRPGRAGGGGARPPPVGTLRHARVGPAAPGAVATSPRGAAPHRRRAQRRGGPRRARRHRRHHRRRPARPGRRRHRHRGRPRADRGRARRGGARRAAGARSATGPGGGPGWRPATRVAVLRRGR